MTVKDTNAMIASMTPVLTEGLWVYCVEPDPARSTPLIRNAFAMIREAEGITLILPTSVAAEAGYDCTLSMRLITLNVFSDLEGIGLTAAVAQALTQAGISCNVVAAYHHDHVFVPETDAERALAALQDCQRSAENI
ncbi:ACT domain-containing protein [uncultured Tateyamaria sp.]|uniref:ACT domain-containing protein n=1 Tax=uncultured Tateyamaria sp. TaxID=455651 RepID=UPI002615A96A|nr:ACT domain-containing protein [uncultured Tateyamaria sp.]